MKYCSGICKLKTIRILFGTYLLIAVVILGGCVAPSQYQKGDFREHPDPSFLDFLEAYSGRDWYGAYMHDKKVGTASVKRSFLNGIHGKIYRIEMDFSLKIKRDGSVFNWRRKKRFDFSAVPPYALLSGSVVTKNKRYTDKRKIVRMGNRYFLRITFNHETRNVVLDTPEISLKHQLALETWLRTAPDAKDHMDFELFDTRKMEPVKKSVSVQRIKEGIEKDKICQKYVLTVKNGKEDATEIIYKQNGTKIKWLYDEFVELRLEPVAKAKAVAERVDLFELTIVKMDRKLGKKRKDISELKLRIDGPKGFILSSGPGQRVTSCIKEHSFEVTLEPDEIPRYEASREEKLKYIRASEDHTEGHQKIGKLAKKAIGDAKSTEEKVKRLVSFVYKYIEGDTAEEPMTVMDIVSSRKGDCTEYAALFAVLARELGIPCRVVSGLMYMGDKRKGFGAHAWNEVVINNFWRPVDASWNQVIADAGHIRFGESNAIPYTMRSVMPEVSIKLLSVK